MTAITLHRSDPTKNLSGRWAKNPKFGPKVELTLDRLSHARKLIDQGKTPTEATKIIGIGRTTLYGALQRAVA
jgi:hypothetical protein